MTEFEFFRGLIVASLAISVVVFLALTLITAPYGRHTRAGWGPQVRSTTGWIIMEAPASLVFFAFYFLGEHRFETTPLVLLAVWQAHYLHRAFIFPFRRRGGDKPMPLLVALMGVVFNVSNVYLNSRWISHFGHYSSVWLLDPRLLAGVTIFAAGFAINFHSDEVLLRLRKPGETGYKIPAGGFYRWVSSPNYLGELVEWSGWALATWSLAGLTFVVWTAANLVPRAIANHRWYRTQFPNYPLERKRIVPFSY
jgi:protein-S-isoprenylcysteine O-methyltransferase Ste14